MEKKPETLIKKQMLTVTDDGVLQACMRLILHIETAKATGLEKS